MKTLRTSSAADRDIVECAAWLEAQRPDLGNDFLDAVDAALLEITAHPLSCPTLVLEHCQLKLPLRWLCPQRFPHTIIFHVGDEEIMVYAVVHPQRDLESLLRERIGVR
jgi:plasmid stabilization system protein ParE